MTDEAMKKLREVEDDSSGDVNLGGPFDTEEKMSMLGIIEKAQKLEHAERELRLKEAQQKLESEKFEYQKVQTKKDNRVKLGTAIAAGGGAILVGVAKLAQVFLQRKYVKEAYNIEQVTTIASPTARMLLKDGTSPKI